MADHSKHKKGKPESMPMKPGKHMMPGMPPKKMPMKGGRKH